MATPSLHCLTISIFEDWKADSSSGLQENGTLEERRCLKGSIMGQEANAYETCATAPNQDRMSGIDDGVGKFRILSWNVLVGWTPFAMRWNPTNSTSDSAN